MTRNKENKLNQFLLHAPPSEVITSTWLETQGISSKLAWWYVHAGLLEKIGSKAYKKAGEQITWTGVISALQNQLQLPIHPGGKTALQALGLGHFIIMEAKKQIQLFAPLTVKIPKWLHHSTFDSSFSVIKTSLFNDENQLSSIISQTIEGKTLRISCPEQAAMELLHLYPQKESFNEVSYLMENLNQLRPDMVQALLECCNSIKVKRLFLHFGDAFNHPWMKRLNLDNITLGEGKRLIEPGGKYQPKYKISLPEIKE